MSPSHSVQIFLEDSLLDSARKGEHNFIRLMVSELETAGFPVEFLHKDDRPSDHDGYSLVHMKPPLGRKGLCFRRVYHYPFWQIDATDRRWARDVARAPFEPNSVDPAEAARFQRFWRKRLYGQDDVEQAPHGPVYVPLQGQLTRKRSFQTMCPTDMLERTLHLDTAREVIATLHPKERYSSSDRDALAKLEAKHRRLKVTTAPPREVLPICAYVVTQNSGVAFDGFLFNRPAILFAKIDFHHIAQDLTRMSEEDAFDRVLVDRPDFAKYLHWFWQDMSINAGREDAPGKIQARLRDLGWPI